MKLRMRIALLHRQRKLVTSSFVDTDVVVRLLTGDDPVKQHAAEKLFSKVERGKQSLSAPDTMIADVVYVLASTRLYHLPRHDTCDMLVALIRLPNLPIENKSAVLRALDVFSATNLDFGDAVIISSMRQAGIATVFSFDRDFDHIEGIARSEPKF